MVQAKQKTWTYFKEVFIQTSDKIVTIKKLKNFSMLKKTYAMEKFIKNLTGKKN